MVLRAVLISLAVMGVAATGQAETAPVTPAPGAVVTQDTLAETLHVAEVMGAMRDEGLDYAASLEDQMFPGRGGPSWRTAAAKIYDTAAMQARFDAVLMAELPKDAATLGGIVGFFGSPLGQRVLGLELEARHALLDDSAEEAARARVDEMAATDDPRLKALERFAEANDLVEMNVQGALNANLAFYKGLAEGGGLAADMTEDDMLSDVWSQEPDIRAESGGWLFAYMALAYEPLSDAEMAKYEAFSRSPEGQALNMAMFKAFDVVFSDISHQLGLAAARQMQGEDI